MLVYFIFLAVFSINFNLANEFIYSINGKETRKDQNSFNVARHPDEGLNVTQLIKKYNYPVETYDVITEDKYQLTMHRIPYGKLKNKKSNKPIVFLMHGLLASSADWILMGPDRGLAYLLADLGYDVWMGNARGNYYSRRHVYLKPDTDDIYWEFSWHEIGLYDLPAMIDKVLSLTREKNLYYIGHSQGSTVFFVMTSMLPEYNEKIRLCVALAPAVFMSNLESPIIKTAVFLKAPTEFLLDLLGFHEFLPKNNLIQQFSSMLCANNTITQTLCSNILFLIVGFDQAQLDKDRLTLMLSSTPAGSATKQFIHYAQEVESKKFEQFDYGVFRNLFKYKSMYPPKYNLSNVVCPVALFAGKSDLMVSIKDVDQLFKELPNVVQYYKVPYEKFTHLDFVWGLDVVSLLYKVIFKTLKLY